MKDLRKMAEGPANEKEGMCIIKISRSCSRTVARNEQSPPLPPGSIYATQPASFMLPIAASSHYACGRGPEGYAYTTGFAFVNVTLAVLCTCTGTQSSTEMKLNFMGSCNRDHHNLRMLSWIPEST